MQLYCTPKASRTYKHTHAHTHAHTHTRTHTCTHTHTQAHPMLAPAIKSVAVYQALVVIKHTYTWLAHLFPVCRSERSGRRTGELGCRFGASGGLAARGSESFSLPHTQLGSGHMPITGSLSAEGGMDYEQQNSGADANRKGGIQGSTSAAGACEDTARQSTTENRLGDSYSSGLGFGSTGGGADGFKETDTTASGLHQLTKGSDR